MPEAITIEPAQTRFLNSDNQLIAFEFMVILALCFAVKTLYSNNKEMTAALNKLSEMISILTESVRNVKGK